MLIKKAKYNDRTNEIIIIENDIKSNGEKCGESIIYNCNNDLQIEKKHNLAKLSVQLCIQEYTNNIITVNMSYVDIYDSENYKLLYSISSDNYPMELTTDISGKIITSGSFIKIFNEKGIHIRDVLNFSATEKGIGYSKQTGLLMFGGDKKVILTDINMNNIMHVIKCSINVHHISAYNDNLVISNQDKIEIYSLRKNQLLSSHIIPLQISEYLTDICITSNALCVFTTKRYLILKDII